MAVFKLLKGGRCKCGAGAKSDACTCERDKRYTFSFRFRDEQFTRRTDATNKEDAEKLEAAFLKLCRSKSVEEQLAVLKYLKSDDSRMRRVCSTLGEVMAAYEGHWHLWLNSRTGARRNVTDLALVCAYGLDLWTKNEGGRKGVKVGAKVPDMERIRKLSCGVLKEDLVNRYFLARQCEAGMNAGKVVWIEAKANASWNKTLAHACDVFGEEARRHAFKGLSLPDLAGFIKAPRLPEAEALPEPFLSAEFARLCEAFDALRETNPDLWLLNLIMRQTGMRPRYVMGLRGSWLVERENGEWSIQLKSRPEEGFGKKKGKKSATLNQWVPVSELVRSEIVARGMGLTIAGGLTKSARVALEKQHNALIKKLVGDEGSHGQGAYRYRDTVASVMADQKGVEGAQLALGHKSALTTLQHYVGALPGVSGLMRAELAAWLNLPAMQR